MLTYKERKKLIKRVILWSVIIGGIVALFIPTFSSSQVLVEASDIRVTQDNDICELTPGGCVGNVDNLEEGEGAITGVAAIILNIAKWMTYFAAAISVIYIIIGAFYMISSPGNKDSFDNGVKTVRNAVIGLIVALLAIWIVQIITGFFESMQDDTASVILPLLK